MPTSEEDLLKKQEEIKKLRGQVADAEAKRTTREVDLANDVNMAQLEAEEAALRARLDVAKERSKVSVVKEGAAAPLDAAKARMEQAVAQQKAVAEAGTAAARATDNTPATSTSGDEAAKSGAAAESEKKGN